MLFQVDAHLVLFYSKFWTRNRPGDKMRDRYNLNLLPGMSEDGVEYGKLQRPSRTRTSGSQYLQQEVLFVSR